MVDIKNIIVGEMARCMLKDMGLSNKLWDEYFHKNINMLNYFLVNAI